MTRPLLAPDKIEPSALHFIQQNHAATVAEVEQAIRNNEWVVVGMGQNPVVKKAKVLLEEKNIPFHELSYGNYFSEWKRRLAIKLWSGWPTFPQVFHKGHLVGGHEDLVRYLDKKK